MSLFNDIKTGLNEAIEFEKGNVKARTTKVIVKDTVTFEPSDIKRIRNNTGLTQASFSKYMGVSIKTVEAWEAGRNQPDGAARRLLELTQANPQFPQNSGIVVFER